MRSPEKPQVLRVRSTIHSDLETELDSEIMGLFSAVIQLVRCSNEERWPFLNSNVGNGSRDDIWLGR